MQKVDVFLACAPKDFVKLPFVVASIVKHIPERGKIVICSPVCVPNDILGEIKDTVFYTFDDTTVLDCCDRSKWTYRPNWCFQQHLKLFQEVTDDWYITLDCDTIINREMRFFENEKPIWYKGRDQLHPPYFTFMGYMIDIGRLSGTSYIADMNLFYRPFIKEMLEKNQLTIQTFIEKSQKITNKYCYIAEPELYGNYCMRYHDGFYVEKQLKQGPILGKTQEGIFERKWSKEEVVQLISEMADKDYDTFSMHSWLDEGDQIK